MVAGRRGRLEEATVGVKRAPFAVALRRSLAAGYGARELRADVLAGLVVGVVALPLSMALAIAVRRAAAARALHGDRRRDRRRRSPAARSSR